MAPDGLRAHACRGCTACGCISIIYTVVLGRAIASVGLEVHTRCFAVRFLFNTHTPRWCELWCVDTLSWHALLPFSVQKSIRLPKASVCYLSDITANSNGTAPCLHSTHHSNQHRQGLCTHSIPTQLLLLLPAAGASIGGAGLLMASSKKPSGKCPSIGP